jgi:hypothetical protein
MTINLAQYYDRFDAADNYERHLFRAGNVLQSSELNELQSSSMFRLQQVTDALLKEGDVLSGADIVVNPTTGATTITGGALYLRGAVRGVPPGSMTVPVVGLVIVGVYITEAIITELENPDLRDPAISFRNYQEPGAARLQIICEWGYEGDGHTGDFYPVFEILDGYLVNKKLPSNVDAVAQAIARYDRQSAGGYYVSSGMAVTRLDDTQDGDQVFSVAAGVARVNGEEIIQQHARTLVFEATPSTRLVTNETHLAAGGTERVTVDYPPIHTVTQLSVVRQETTSITHGLPGSLDPIYGPGNVLRTSIVSLISVEMGETTYVEDQDYQLTASKVDWSLLGDEPSPGETYDVTYTYRDTFVPQTYDYTGLEVTDAVADTEILITYEWALPRYDLICLDVLGYLRVVTGISAPLKPRVPTVPSGMLNIAVVEQHWDTNTRIINNASRMVPMRDLNYMNRRIDTLFALMAEERLKLDLSQRDLAAKKGVFADPFLDDDLRDEGLEQTAAIMDGNLTLGIAITGYQHVLEEPAALTPTGWAEIITQPLKTGTMAVNPYDSFSPLPAVVRLTPPQDFWTVKNSTFTSPETRIFEAGDVYENTEIRKQLIRNGVITGNESTEWLIEHGYLVVRDGSSTRTTTAVVRDSTVLPEFLRQIVVRFDLSGYAPGEILESVTFDGRSVNFEAV